MGSRTADAPAARTGVLRALRPYEVLACALLATGAVLFFALPWPWSTTAWGVGVAMAACVGLALAQRSRRVHGIALAIGVVLLAAMLVVCAEPLRMAAAFAANVFIDAWNAQVDGYVLHFAVTSVPEAAGVLLALFGGLAAALAFHVMCSLRSRAWVGVAVALLLAAGLFLQTIVLPSFACLTLGTLLLLGFNSARAEASARVMPAFLATMLLVVSAALLVCAGYGGSATLATAKADLLATVDEARYGSDTLPQGDLTAAHSMNVARGGQETDRVEVSFPDARAAASSEPLYLRGYAGSVYTGTAFERMRSLDYEGDWTGMFTWFASRDFDAMSQYSAYQALEAEETGALQGPVDVSVSVQGAYRRYAYAPTAAASDAAGTSGSLLDLYRTSGGFDGSAPLTFSVETDAPMAEGLVPGNWVYDEATVLSAGVGNAGAGSLTTREREFLRSELAYRSFVYDQYLDVSDEAKEAVDQFFFSEGTDEVDDSTLASLATRIRTLLDVSCEYNAQGVRFAPGAESAGDFVTWFLEDAREGNAAAFASAAVLAFREAGVPARYAEGYLLDEDGIERMAQEGASSRVLTERDAHAWVEVYVDGAGWMPVEVTPGFYNRGYASDEVIEVAREVAGGGNDSADTGSTGGDEQSWVDLLPEPLRPFAWLGLVLLVLLAALVALGLLELQRWVRLRLWNGALRRAGVQGAASVPLFGRMQRLAKDAGAQLSDLNPRSCAGALAAARPELHAAELERAVSLMERERYGQIPLEEFEVDIVEGLLDKMEAGNWERAGRLRRAAYRYQGLYRIPLRRV